MTAKEKRMNEIARHEKNLNDDGRNGKAFELMCAREKSRKTKVAEQNEIDISIKMEVNGKIRYIPAECKTNGGRVDEMLNGKSKAKFVIYRLDFKQKLKNSVDERKIPPVIVPVDLFVNMLRECNAIKAINRHGEFDGYGIQCSSKKMFLRLAEYIDNYGECVLFNNEKTFEDWALEGLEL